MLLAQYATSRTTIAVGCETLPMAGLAILLCLLQVRPWSACSALLMPAITPMPPLAR